MYDSMYLSGPISQQDVRWICWAGVYTPGVTHGVLGPCLQARSRKRQVSMISERLHGPGPVLRQVLNLLTDE